MRKYNKGKPKLPSNSKGKPKLPKINKGKPKLSKSNKGKPKLPKNSNGKPKLPKNSKSKSKLPKNSKGKPKLHKNSKGKLNRPKSYKDKLQLLMRCINNRNSRDKLMISNKGHINKIILTLVKLRLKEELMELLGDNLQVLMLKHQHKEWVVVRA